MKYFCIVSMFFSFLLLSSCKTTEPVSVKDTHISNTGMLLQSLVAHISQDISTDNAFLTCSSSAIDMCIQEYWYDVGKEISCDEYLLESNRASCKTNKIVATAKAAGDIAGCASLKTPEKESCEFEIVTQKALTANDAKLCSSLEEKTATMCFNRVIVNQAHTEKDEKLCDQIRSLDETDTLEKDMCIQEVQYEKAQVIQNPSLEK